MLVRSLVAALALIGAVCGPRSAAADVDLTGRWQLHLEIVPSPLLVDFVQTGSALEVRGVDFPDVIFSGTIDPVTGAFAMTGTPNSCGTSTFDGLAAPNGATLTGQQVLYFDGFPPGCDPVPTDVIGVRDGGCGDGIIQPPEECDDGGNAAGDGCTPACRQQTCWSCAGMPSVCTLGACDLCAPEPRPLCGETSPSVRRTLQIKDKLNDKGDRLSWTWPKGGAIGIAELGDPTATTDFALCIYDRSGGMDPTRIFVANAPGGSTCNGKPCWRTKGTGFTYKDGKALHDGLAQISIVGGDFGRATIKVKAKGTALPTPTLPLAPQPRVTVQLQNSIGGCWEERYSPVGAVNTPSELSMRPE